MRCPYCGHDLSGSVLPARCPYCHRYLSPSKRDASEVEGARKAEERRREVEGLVGSKRYRRVGSGSFLVALFIVLLSLAAFVGIGMYLGLLGSIHVPDVNGWIEERALDELRSDGFTVAEVDQVSDQPEGYVIDVSPEAGSLQSRGSLVTISISRKRVMPDVVGKSKDEATSALDSEGIAYNIVEQPSDKTAGTVLSSDTAAGTALSDSVTVNLKVAVPLSVPSIMGKSAADAKAAVEACGLVFAPTYVEATGTQASDVVVAVDPKEGASVATGSTVSVSITRSSRTVEQSASEIVKVVYDCDPLASNGYPIGSGLRKYLSGSVVVHDSKTGKEKAVSEATDFEVWYGVVKHWTGFPTNQGDDKQGLTRKLLESPQVTKKSDTEVSVYLQVQWDWSRAGHQGMTSWDGRTVTLTFDEGGQLVSLDDSLTDVPKYSLG